MGMGQNYLATDAINEKKHYKNIGGPTDLAIDPNTDRLYISNYVSGNVTAVDIKTNEIITSYVAGDSPSEIAINPIKNLIYVANPESDTISIIDGSVNKVVVGVTFKVNPSEAGTIKCDKKESLINEYIRVPFGPECIADPNSGYQFSSWVENFRNNALLTSFGSIPQDNSSNIEMRKYGDFTVNFQSVPPPIPPDYWIPLYGIIISTVVGWSIPSMIGWARSRREVGVLYRYQKRIKLLYDDGKLDQDDIQSLDNLRSDISDAYAKGKINDQHYTNLKDEISILYEEIYQKKIDSIQSSKPDSEGNTLLDQMSTNISDAYAKGEINEMHYKLLNEKIAKTVTESKSKAKLSMKSSKKSPI